MARCVTGNRAPLPTVKNEVKGEGEESIPALLDMWDVATVSKNYSEEEGGCVATPAELGAVYRAEVSQG